MNAKKPKRKYTFRFRQSGEDKSRFCITLDNELIPHIAEWTELSGRGLSSLISQLLDEFFFNMRNKDV